MNETIWRAERDSRSLIYAQRVFDSKKPIRIKADYEYASRYDGQVAIITAANLLGRMTPAVTLDIPDVQIVHSLPWRGQSLQAKAKKILANLDPWARFEVAPPSNDDYILHLGPKGEPMAVHGSGWNIYVGPSPSVIPVSDGINPVGPALSVIIAVSNMFFHQLNRHYFRFIANALDWTEEVVASDIEQLSDPLDIGSLWTVGTGSVGTAILFFLTLADTQFSPSLFDMDKVEDHNLDRSPIFIINDIGLNKVAVTKKYLESIGIKNVIAEAHSLDESSLWKNRQQGTPDIMISAANERNVRYIIENGLPPVQIYGTTGRNWQASVIRHIPKVDPCSCCLFPGGDHTPTKCATGLVTSEENKQVDASLPFLSFAAGLMATAEILKLQLPGYPFSANRATLYTWGSPRIANEGLSVRPECICISRSRSAHAKMLKGSRYSELT